MKWFILGILLIEQTFSWLVSEYCFNPWVSASLHGVTLWHHFGQLDIIWLKGNFFFAHTGRNFSSKNLVLKWTYQTDETQERLIHTHT